MYSIGNVTIFPLPCTISHMYLLPIVPIILNLPYQHGLLVTIYDTHAYSFIFLPHFSTYLSHPSFLYIYWAKSPVHINLFLPWNSNKYHSHLITSSLVHCKDFLGKTPSLDRTWAVPRPWTLSWVSIKDLWALTRTKTRPLLLTKGLTPRLWVKA